MPFALGFQRQSRRFPLIGTSILLHKGEIPAAKTGDEIEIAVSVNVRSGHAILRVSQDTVASGGVVRDGQRISCTVREQDRRMITEERQILPGRILQ